jgi:hypothetical protein
MIYARPAWEFVADTRVMKLQCLQNKVLHTFGNYPRHTPVRDLHMAFQILFVLITKQNCAGNKQKSYKIMLTKMFAILDKAKPVTENIRASNLAVIKHTADQVSRLPW